MSGAAPSREVAYRVFANEFAEATFSYAESDDDRAPQYLVTPTGARVNRLFVVGVLTEIEEVSDGVLRARIVDPTGAFVLYAGQYQPDALAFFERADPPSFVALTGKARTFEPEGSDRIFTSLRPEQVNEVDPETRDSWVVETAQQTLARAGLLSQALELDERGNELAARLGDAGVEPGLAAGIPHAIEEYDPTTGYLAAVQEMALDAVRVVAGEIGEVSATAGAPDQAGSGDVLTGFSNVTLAPAVPDQPSGAETEDSAAAEVTHDSETEAEPLAEPNESPAEVEAPEKEVSSSGADPEEPPTTEPATEKSEPEPDEPAEEPEPTETSEPPEEEPSSRPEETEESAADSAEQEESADEEFYELSEEERAAVEENYDVGFETGSDIGSPEETPDIKPEAEIPDEPEAETPDKSEEKPVSDEKTSTEAEDGVEDGTGEAEPDDEVEVGDEEAEAADAGVAESGSGEEIEESAEEDEEFSDGELQNLVVDTLKELGDGEGVPRSELIETIQDRHDVEETAIEDAIEAALLGGRCFESGAEDLKPI